MEYNSKKSRKARVMRFLGRAVPAILAAGVLAACGGGGGGGDEPPPAQPCDSQTSRGAGFAIGSCAATTTNVFQPVDAQVVVNGVDAYTLTLVFPADLAGLNETAIAFDAGLKPPDELRNIIGILQGQAYENPKQGETIEPPYVAITDFFQARNYADNVAQPSFKYASFGTWEKFAGSGPTGFNEGYLGIWYAERPGAVVRDDPPNLASTYKGRVVGIVGDGPGEPKAIGGRYGFSAPITVQVAGGRITGAQLGDLTISSQPAGGTLVAHELAMNQVVFEASSQPPGILTGDVSSLAGNEASITGGVYEARYFGVADLGSELAGRFRFTTSNGLIGVASFGAIRQAP